MKPSNNYTSNEDPLSSLNLFFTGRCNLNCHYCFVDRINLEHATVNEASLKHSIDLLFSYPGKIKKISFKGGEPLLEFELVKKVYDYAQQEADKKQIILDGSLVTNGTILNQKMVDYFIKHKMNIMISIDGNKETQDKNRPFKGDSGESSFDKIIFNLNSVSLGDLQLTGSIVFTPENMNQLVENIKFLSKRNFRYIEFYPDLYAEWTEKSLEKIKQVFQNFEFYYKGLFSGNQKVFKNYYIDKVVNNLDIKKSEQCMEIQINAEKEFYICDKVFSLEEKERKKYVIGNIESGLNEQKRKEMLLQLSKDFIVDSELGCSDCSVKKYCFCPVGHHIHALNLRLKGQEKKAKNFYKTFCSFSKIYSGTFLRIKSELQFNSRFIEEYQFIALGK